MARSLVLLDALGTLVRLEPPGPALRSELDRRFGIVVGEDEAARALAAEITYYRAHLNEGRDAGALATLRTRCAEVVRAALPPSPRLAALSDGEMTEALLAALRFTAFPDVAPALRAARARGRQLIVVSNWDCSLPDVLARVGLDRAVDGVLTSAVYGAPKPSPVMFRAALQRAGCAPGDAVHVGDGLVEDVEGARAAGVRAVLVRRDGSPGPPGVTTIASLDELEAALP